MRIGHPFRLSVAVGVGSICLGILACHKVPQGTTATWDGGVGITLQYPASWALESEEHVPMELYGPNDCSVILVDMEGVSDPEPIEQDIVQQKKDLPAGTVTQERPAWAGPVQPAASFAYVNPDHQRGWWHHARVLQYDNTFRRNREEISILETMQPGDAVCVKDLQQIERSVHFAAALPPQEPIR